MPAKVKTASKVKYEPVLQLPPLSPDQYDALKANIAINGVLVPILVDSDGPRRKIIDGNYRKMIAVELGYDCPEIVQSGLDEEEKRTLARCLNLARRQLNTEQKREVIADQLREMPNWTNRRIGKMLGVSHPFVASVRAEMESVGNGFQQDRRVGSDGKQYKGTKYGFRGAGSYSGDPRPSAIHTPPGVCRYLYDLISPHYKVKTILDPSSGAGALTRPWKGQKVIAFETARGQDFFACHGHVDCDLVLCNPPFNNESGEGRAFLPQSFLEQMLRVVAAKTPIVLVTPMGMRLNQRKTSVRWRWLRDHCPAITSIISLPLDVFEKVLFHSEVLLFNMPKLKPHYFLPDRYLR